MKVNSSDLDAIKNLRDHYDAKQGSNEFERMDYIVGGKPISEEVYDEALRQPLLDKLELQPDSRVLDIGCGAGLVISRIENQCAKVVGIDISKNLISLYKGKAEVFVCAAHEMDFADGSFDRIYMLSVGVHFPNFQYFKSVVDKCLDMLDVNGILVVSDLIVTGGVYSSQYLVVDVHELVDYLEAKKYPYSISAQNSLKRSFSKRKDVIIYKDAVAK